MSHPIRLDIEVFRSKEHCYDLANKLAIQLGGDQAVEVFFAGVQFARFEGSKVWWRGSMPDDFESYVPKTGGAQ